MIHIQKLVAISADQVVSVYRDVLEANLKIHMVSGVVYEVHGHYEHSVLQLLGCPDLR